MLATATKPVHIPLVDLFRSVELFIDPHGRVWSGAQASFPSEAGQLAALHQQRAVRSAAELSIQVRSCGAENRGFNLYVCATVIMYDR